MFKLLTPFMILLFLVGSSYAKSKNRDDNLGKQKEREVLGVLIKVSRANFNRLKTNRTFQRLKSRYQLRIKKYFRTSQFLQLDSPPQITQENLKGFCSQVVKISGILSCDLNQRLQPDVVCEINGHQTLQHQVSSVIEATENDCSFPKPRENILPKQGDPIAPGEKEGLDAFWVQEYIGADLLRAKLENLNSEDLEITDNLTNNLVQVWDSEHGNHGELASSLMAGPSPASILPQKRPIPFHGVGYVADVVDGYETAHQMCKIARNCPAYIGNSMSWDDGTIVQNVFRNMSREHGTVVITSAGNLGSLVQPAKNVLAEEGRLIVVGNLDPLGDPYDSSNYGTGVTISAPASNLIRSYDFQNRPHTFGGTSAARPLVTGSLLAFTQITGHKLNTQQAKDLLQKTAIHFPGLPSSNSMGAGMLNTYKIGEVAFKLKEICKNSSKTKYHQCIASRLRSDSTYQFDLTKRHRRVFANVQKAFPFCFSRSRGQQTQNITCRDQQDSLRELREIAFLNPLDGLAWRTLACINKKNGLSKHAEFYERLARRLNMSDEDVIDQILAEKDYDKLKYASSKENIYQIATRLLDQGDVKDAELSRTLDFLGDQLRHEDIPNFKSFLTKALRHRNANRRTFFSVDKIIQKNFGQIDQPRAFLTHIIQNTNADIPVQTITTHFQPLMKSQGFWNTLMESEKITDHDLAHVGRTLVAHHNETSNFRQKFDEVINHRAVNDGYVASSLFENIIGAYNDIPNAKEFVEFSVKNDRVRGDDLGFMGSLLIGHYDENPDFEDTLQSIMSDERADENTFSRLSYSVVDHHQRVEDFPELLQSIIHHEKANDKAVQRGTVSLMNSDMPFSTMRQTWSIIASNNQRTSVACSRATSELSHAVLQSNPVPQISRKLNFIYRECDKKVPQREANIQASNFVGNLYPGNRPRKTSMFKFLIDQADAQGLLKIHRDLTRQKSREEESRIFGTEHLNTLTHFLTLTENALRSRRGR